MNEAHHSHHHVNQASSYRTSIKLIIGISFTSVCRDDDDDNDDDSDCGSECWEVTQRECLRISECDQGKTADVDRGGREVARGLR